MRNIFYALFAVALMLTSCTVDTTFPPITETATNQYRHGKFVWRDLVTTNAPGSAQFYGDVFGWEIRRGVTTGVKYYEIRNRGELIGGILDLKKSSGVSGNEWLTVMSVPAVDRTISIVEDLNGSIMFEETRLPGRGDMAIVVDPTEGIFGALKANEGDPASMDPQVNGWLWQELWSNDPAVAKVFYEKMGFEVTSEKDGDRDYWILSRGGERVGGMMQNPLEGARTAWIPYIRVEDPGATCSRVVRFGGNVIMPPSKEVRDGAVAVCSDPYGGPFALQKWEE